MTRTSIRLALILSLSSSLGLVAAGCGEDNPESDAGPGVDSGMVTGTDSGPGVDAGPGTDSGPSGTDAGPLADGGGTDAGPTGSDAGPPSCAMGRIHIEETCPAFAPCGGDPIGEWCYADICVTKAELLAQVLDNPQVPEDCDESDIQVISSTGTISGTVSVTATNITRMVTSSAMGEFYLGSDCTLGGCGITGIIINSALGASGSASCVDGADSGCNCDITFDSGVDESVAYTTSGSSIIYTGSGRQFDYCVDGTGLTFRQEPGAGSGTVEPGIQLTLPVTGT